MLLGGGFFGFAGMALGVPVFAVIYRYASMGTSSRLRRRNMKSDTWDYADYSKYEIEKEDLTQDE